MDVIPQTPYERLAPLRNDYNKRLRTFDHRWPPNVPVTPQALAQDGFYYTGLDDKVQCTHCGGILSGWCEGDIVDQEHRQHFPNCPWVRQGGMQNGYTTSSLPTNMADLPSFSVSHQMPTGENFNFRYESSLGPNDIPGVTRPKFQNYAMESARKASFTGWPTQITQRPEVLCKAGFFYLGEGDKCKCFYCGGILWDWEPGDDPWVEHAKWFPDCPWIKLAKGDQFIQRVQEEMNRMQIDDEVSHGPIAQETTVKSVVDPSSSSVSDYAASGPSTSSAAGASKIPVAESAAAGTSKSSTEENASDKEKKLKEILEENRTLKEQKLCKICLDEDVGVLFEPCGHICCCASCAAPLQQCPMCRQPIKKSLKVVGLRYAIFQNFPIWSVT